MPLFQNKAENIMQDEDINTEYPTYNGMDRPAMIAGAPIVPLMISVFSLTITGLVGQLIIGRSALLLVGLSLPIYLGLRTISENDDQAFRVYALEAKWLLRRFLSGARLGTYSLHAGKYGRNIDDYQNYQRLLEQNAQPHGEHGRLHAQNLPTRY